MKDTTKQAPFGPGESGGERSRPVALYYDIARTALENLDKKSLQFETKKNIITVIVFSALCLEAYINQEYFDHPETKSLTEKNDFRRSTTETKYEDLSKYLKTTKTFDKGRLPYQTFKELISVRNEYFVHYKPELGYIDQSTAPKERTFEDYVTDIIGTKKFFNCVGEMIRELNKLTDGKSSIPGFLSGEKASKTVWKDVSLPFSINSESDS